MNDDEKVIYFGETDARNKRTKFGIKKKDRSRHMYAIGKTGMGKSTLLESLAIQDIQNGDGIAFIDPHGKSADYLLDYVPEHRIKDVVYFAPFDMEYPISFNVMEDVGPERRYLVASGLMSAFKKVWVDAWSARMEYILGNIMLAILEYPGSTLISVNRMLTDKDFRKEVVNHITDPTVRSFWVNEYAAYTDKFAAEAAPAIQNKVGQFVANPLIRNIIGQAKSSFDIRKIMDEKKILIINLSKGRVGEANANLLGSMLITKIYLGAMSRADLSLPELELAPNFYMYVDEFQSFANESFADILSEARKYKLNLIIAHQYIEQMTEEVRAAVFGNVGTMCVFRVGATDAEYLEKEFAPLFTAEDLVNLQKYQMYLKLMIDGVTSTPFSAAGMAPIKKAERTFVKEIIDASRAQYARPRNEVEDEIRIWHETQFGKGGGGAAPRPAGGQGAPAPQQNRPPQQSGPAASQGPRPADNRGAAPQQRFEPRPPVASNSPSHSPQRTEPRTDRPDLRGRPPQQPMQQGRTPDRGFPPRRDGQRPPSPQGDNRGMQRPQGNVPPPIQNKEEAVDREGELRKAISLSYLKDPEPEVKNDDKTPKPENLAALRDVLLSVMQSAAPEAKAQTPEPIKPISEPKIEQPEQRRPEPVPTPLRNEAPQNPGQQKKHHPSYNMYPKLEPVHTLSDKVDMKKAADANANKFHEKPQINQNRRDVSEEVSADLLQDIFNEN